MPSTNRPFFSNFFAAFRAQSALQKSPASTTSSTQATTTSANFSPVTRTITTKPNTSATAATVAAVHAAAQLHSARTHQYSTTTSTSPSSQQAYGPHPTPQTAHRGRNMQSPTMTPATPTAVRRRRGSDVSSSGNSFTAGSYASSPHSGSSEGLHAGLSPSNTSMQTPFRDALRAEKWYIGGRTAGGEERFYKLGLVRRYSSQDRLSLDRVSL